MRVQSMTAWRRWLTCSLIAGMLGVTVVPARADAASITLRGNRSTSIDLTIPTDITLDFASMQLTGSGQFTGVYLEAISVPVAQRVEPNRHTGAIAFRDVHAPGEPAYVFPFVATSPSVLKAGKYRLYLLADGATKVRIPVSGGRSWQLVPTRPVVTAIATAPNILVSPIEARNVQPLTIAGARSINMSAMLTGGFRAYAGQIGTCLRRSGSDCGSATNSGIDGPFTGVGVNPVEDYGMAWRVNYQPGTLYPGTYEAYQGALNVGGLQYASGAAFSLSLS